ncbi:hypothetical protein GGI43DRAFT_97498 [Trichoderma evansii]
MFSKLFAATVLATAASAHMKISSPVPYGASTLKNDPLLLDGSNFPCQLRDNGYDLEGASNVFAQGSTQKLAFIGSAVHGGGSCQISVTTDAQPDKNSVWKVIKSIEGGCPAKGQEGNMGDNAAAVDPFTYDYTIPKELQSGNYTLAWTWFNKVGNREMYMNCAPLTVTGSGGSKDFLNTLPDMFQANIFDVDGCRTVDDKDLRFPNPGNDVDYFNGTTSAFGGPTVTVAGTKTCASATAGGAAPTNSGSGSAPTGSPAQPTQASVPGGVFITSPPASQPAATQPAASQPAASPPAVSQPAASQPVVTSAQSQAPAPAVTSAAPPPPAPSSGSNASAGSSPKSGFAAGTACSTEGQWNCIDGTHFQRCASGSWSASMAVAAGTSCQSGQAASLNMVTKRGKKSMRHAVRMRA